MIFSKVEFMVRRVLVVLGVYCGKCWAFGFICLFRGFVLFIKDKVFFVFFTCFQGFNGWYLILSG